ncbi:MAG: hypothetical protein R2699_13040 [Acidimicrobiales bacterium]
MPSAVGWRNTYWYQKDFTWSYWVSLAAMTAGGGTDATTSLRHRSGA